MNQIKVTISAIWGLSYCNLIDISRRGQSLIDYFNDFKKDSVIFKLRYFPFPIALL